MIVRLLFIVVLLCCSPAVYTDTDSLFNELLEKYPYDFSVCETVSTSDNQACIEPPGLEMVTLTGEVNIEVILDASGSMAAVINGRTKYQIALESLTAFVEQLPAHVNLGLRVYGHLGGNTEEQKSFSCNSSNLIYPFTKLDREGFLKAVSSVGPTGWTPLGLSLQQAKEDFNRFDQDNNTNLVYLLTDGKETCGGNPAEAAAAINASDISAIVNVIGFDIDAEQEAGLRQIASSGGGEYFSAGDLEELTEVFVSELSWKQWREYFRCRSELARIDINQHQQLLQDEFNCVLAEADKHIVLLEKELEKRSTDIVRNSNVMLRLFEYQQEVTDPYYQRYIDPQAFDRYQEELRAIDARRIEIFGHN